MSNVEIKYAKTHQQIHIITAQPQAHHLVTMEWAAAQDAPG